MKAKRRRRRQASSSSDDDEAGADATALQAPVERRVRVSGVSVDALRSEPAKDIAPGADWGLIQPSKGKGKLDVIEKRMEEYIEAGLQKEFGKTHANAGDTGATQDAPGHEGAEPEEAAEHLEVNHIADVTVPGFNTAITEFKVARDAQMRSADGSEGPRNQRGLEAKAAVPWVPRGAFPSAFGKKRQKRE